MSAERMEFKTELNQLLQIIIHSLYSNKEIFLRELISNASDAIDKVRFESLTKHELLEGNGDWKIKLLADEAAGTLTIRDNGIGMDRAGAVEHLGTIAKSGTKAFLETLKQADAKNRPELIGQFGVGFYSAFMVADRVTVLSRTAGAPENGVKWESDAQGAFTVESATKDTRGTDVILHLKEEDREFLKPWKLRELVKQYSDFVEHPIVMDAEQVGEDKAKTIVEETINSRQALWLRPKNEIKPEEYTAFYRQLTHDPNEPLRSVHYSAEGTIEFRALLFIPAQKPLDFYWGRTEKGLALYIRRVFILDRCETLLPNYLRFVRGVVDSPDLPLNVSRELIQKSALLEKIKNNVTAKALSTLADILSSDRAKYAEFFAELGDILKEGLAQDYANREKIAAVTLFKSLKTPADQWITLDEYLAAKPEGQKEILFLTGETREQLERSPVLEGARAAGQDVLLLTDPVDEFVVDAFREYKGTPLKAVDKGAAPGEVPEDQKKAFEKLLAFAQSRLQGVKTVRLSARLKESAACLVADEGEMGAHLERLMQRIGRQDVSATPRVLELNPAHPAVEAVRALYDRTPDDPRVGAAVQIFLDQALVGEGSKVKDPAAFAQRVNEMLVKNLG